MDPKEGDYLLAPGLAKQSLAECAGGLGGGGEVGYRGGWISKINIHCNVVFFLSFVFLSGHSIVVFLVFYFGCLPFPFSPPFSPND